MQLVGGCRRARAGGRSRRAARGRPAAAPPRPRRCRRPRPGRSGGGRRLWPASARASSSRSATRRLIRCEERSAESIIAGRRRARARASEACSSSRLARMLVSGVRSSCEASATNSRCFFIAASRSARAASSERSICSRVRGQLADLVVGLRLRHVARGVAGVGDLAGGRGQRGDRPHRPAGDRQAGEAGEQGAAEDAGGDEEPEPVDRRVDVGECCARTGRSRSRCRFVADSRGRDPRSPWKVERPLGGRARAWSAFGAVSDQVAVEVVDAHRGVVGADEVVEARDSWMTVPSGV